MPLQTTTESPSSLASSLKSSATPSKPAYLVVYASLINGRSWCGDCRSAESFVEKKFGGGEDIANVVYVGGVDEWRKKENPWRQKPFLITNLPTVVKVTANGKLEKLVESDVYNQRKLDDFVKH